ncbi:sulfite reductase subunit alpha [Massilia soli]|uniref:NADPH--hemoprotein reductase n=1 Tax=Massilia soli TaxID=2792854 RepID=A0ABS7SR41_9BURK|nr:sulfite reductase subunit alpha [Massilia soli]MBZ2208409.1 sulfite reductase subunit alpha [Massilia soli]
MITVDPGRIAAAAMLLCAYAGMCAAIVRSVRARVKTPAAGGDWLVAYASQTGTGEYLAEQTAATLRAAGLAASSASIDTLGADVLGSGCRILFIASTYGEGDAPDSAARFASRLAASDASLAELHYAVLALGDSTYANYCGFGRWLDDTLQARGAQPLFARIDVDRGVGVDAWQHQLSHLAGTSDAPDWSAPIFQPWRIDSRQLLNRGSAGAPVYLISLAPADGPLPPWEAGDLVQVSPPSDPGQPREYSIASVPGDGRLELLVRLHLHDDGSRGAASGWLCEGADNGGTVALRVRQHSRFRLGANAGRPLILIGNGTGIAGLRAHLRARVAAGEKRNWLLFGERNAATDNFFGAEIGRWHRDGLIEQADFAFSRDGAGPRYVQDAVTLRASQIRAWVELGAAIYVCGSLQGMAAGVNAALGAAIGAGQLDALAADGRYQRDVY